MIRMEEWLALPSEEIAAGFVLGVESMIRTFELLKRCDYHGKE